MTNTTPIVCRPHRTLRTWSIILGLPLFLTGVWLYHLVMGGAADMITPQLVTFMLTLISVCCLLPCYIIAANYFCKVIVDHRGVMRVGVPGAGRELPWSRIRRVQLFGEDQLFVKGRPWQRIVLTVFTHTEFALARQTIIDEARRRGIGVEKRAPDPRTKPPF